MGDLLNPVVDQLSRGRGIIEVRHLKKYLFQSSHHSKSSVNGLNLQFENLNGGIEMLAQGLFIRRDDGQPSLDEGWILKKKLFQY